MKSRSLTFFTTITLLAGLAIPVPLAAQESQDHKPKHYHCRIIDIGTFSAPSSYFSSLDLTDVLGPGTVFYKHSPPILTFLLGRALIEAVGPIAPDRHRQLQFGVRAAPRQFP